MKTLEIRQAFLDYFKHKGHTIVPSSALVPANDPTLLFTNAGMVQFKDTFLGAEQRSYVRAVSAQRCVRAGGKHNDLENVGYTARHHTFFEMLGNFSFGDYFKRDAIQYAWTFLTETLQLPQEQLWVTVFTDDDEAADIWINEIGIDPNRFSRCGAADNFWAMGDTGPCGPCSEIFYDHGPDIPGGPPGTEQADGDRYIEIWNLVFMQYNRNAQGELTPLPKPSVDTGMGLERIAAVKQGVHNNYEIDIFASLIESIINYTDVKDEKNVSLRVIADHLRAAAFLIADGVYPSNEGRGYVLRRIIRRALRHGHNVGLKEGAFACLISDLIAVMGDAYQQVLQANRVLIEDVLKKEETQFTEALAVGLKVFTHEVAKLDTKIIPGNIIFLLYDTFGFPADLTADIAREQGLKLDMDGFERLMAQQRVQSRAASQFDETYAAEVQINDITHFTGYSVNQQQSQIVSLYAEGQSVDSLKASQKGWIILNESSFYGEAGGQVGDVGILTAGDNLFIVEDAQKQAQAIIHKGYVNQGVFKLGDQVSACIDSERRQKIKLNHSGTHLLHAALRTHLGPQVTQKGSLVSPDRLRFDFSYSQALSREDKQNIELLVNQQIRSNSKVIIKIMSMDEAKKSGAIALFGEKYGDKVRVLNMGDGFSIELCGGTHVDRTGEIGLFKIISESTIAAGIRRIEAVTGEAALQWVQQQTNMIDDLSGLLKSNAEGLYDKVNQLNHKIKEIERENEKFKAKLASKAGNQLMEQVQLVDGVQVLVSELTEVEPRSLRNTVDQLKQKLGSAVICLAVIHQGKVNLVAGVTSDLIKRVPAGELVNELAHKIGGKGGGRPDFAQAGGPDKEKLPKALSETFAWIRARLLQV